MLILYVILKIYINIYYIILKWFNENIYKFCKILCVICKCYNYVKCFMDSERYFCNVCGFF